jgi:TonB family protein
VRRSSFACSAFFAIAFALSCLARDAHAQADQPADVNAVVPPRLSKDSPARYPAAVKASTESVTVVLVLDVDVSGDVAKAVVDTSGGAAFDESALAAAKGLKFDPAMRGARPIAARIRFVYTFVPPAARVVGRILRIATDAPIAGAVVVVRDAAGKERRTTTAADGSFRIDGLPHGATHVHVEAARNAPTDVDETLAPGEETELVLRLAPASVAEPPPPPPGNGEPIEEVRVVAQRPPREVTKRTISRDEVFSSPGSNGDALRAVQNLPGIARPPPFAGQLVVRGSAPNDTQTFIDGTNVPIIYHFGGLSSVVPSESLDKIDFYPGNFGTQYGRGMGGIIDVGLRNPNDDGKLHGMAQLDSIDMRLLVERSLGKGWSFSASGRRSYFDLWIKLLAGDGITSAPKYYDYQLMVRKELGRDHDVRVGFFGSDDRLEIFNRDTSGGDFILGGNLNAAIAFWRAQAKYQNRLTRTTRLSAVAAIGRDSVTFGIGENYVVLDAVPMSLRTEVSQRLFAQLAFTAGIDILSTSYDVTARFPRPQKPGEPGGGIGSPPLITTNKGSVYTPAAYADLEITPFKGTRIVPGYRADYTNQTSEWNHSPRIVVRQKL